MTTQNTSLEAQGPGSFNDFIEGHPDLAGADRATAIESYSKELQGYKQTLLAGIGDTALKTSPLIQSIGRNDG